MKLGRKGENIPYLKNREIGGALAAPASHFGPFANLFQTGAGRERERKKERNGGKESLLHISSPPFSPPPPPPQPQLQQQRAPCVEDDGGPRGKRGYTFLDLRFEI